MYDLFNRLDINLQSLKEALEQKVREYELSQPLLTSELVLNENASNILKLAVLEARTEHTQMVDVQHLFLAILHDQTNDGAREILEINNMNYDDARLILQQKNGVRDGLGFPDDDEDEEEMSEHGNGSANNRQETATKTRQTVKTPILDNFVLPYTSCIRRKA